MADIYLHERLYRGPEAIQKLAAINIVLCGGGANKDYLAFRILVPRF